MDGLREVAKTNRFNRIQFKWIGLLDIKLFMTEPFMQWSALFFLIKIHQHIVHMWLG